MMGGLTKGAAALALLVALACANVAAARWIEIQWMNLSPKQVWMFYSQHEYKQPYTSFIYFYDANDRDVRFHFRGPDGNQLSTVTYYGGSESFVDHKIGATGINMECTGGITNCYGTFRFATMECGDCWNQNEYVTEDCLSRQREDIFLDRVCSPCPEGKVCDGRHASFCPAHQEPMDDRVSCASCARGSVKYNSEDNFGWCEACPAGTEWVELENGLECSVCPGGTFSAGSSMKCTSCPLGSYSSSGASQCTPCPAGSHGPSAGTQGSSAHCLLCPVGSYQPYQGQAACLACSTATSTGQTTCAGCIDGNQCEGGNIRPCRPGYKCQNGVEEPCSAGEFQPEASAASCRVAPAGFYTPASASGYTHPRRCGPGTYSGRKAVACTACGQGKFAPESGHMECAPCPRGTYKQSNSKCALCPIGKSTANEGAAGESACLAVAHPFNRIWNTGALVCDDSASVADFLAWFAQDHRQELASDLADRLNNVIGCTRHFFEGILNGSRRWEERIIPSSSTIAGLSLFAHAREFPSAITAQILQLQAAWAEVLPAQACHREHALTIHWHGQVEYLQGVTVFRGDEVVEVASGRYVTQGQEMEYVLGSQRALQGGDTLELSFLQDPSAPITAVVMHPQTRKEWPSEIATVLLDQRPLALAPQGENRLLFAVGIEDPENLKCTTPSQVFHSLALPPAVQLLGNQDGQDKVDMGAYDLTAANLFQFCLRAAASLDCPAGTIRAGPSEPCLAHDEHWPVQLAKMGYCATGQDIVGSPLALALVSSAVNGTLFHMLAPGNERAALQSLTAIRDSVMHNVRATSINAAPFAKQLGAVQQDIDTLVRTIAELETLEVKTTRYLKAICVEGNCAASPDRIDRDINQLKVEFQLDAAVEEISSVIYDVWSSLRAVFDGVFTGIQLLGQLVVGAAIELSNQGAARFAEVSKINAESARNRADAAKRAFGKMDIDMETTLRRVTKEAEKTGDLLDSISARFAQLEQTADDFYVARRNAELGKVAKNRIRAIKDIFIGALQVAASAATHFTLGAHAVNLPTPSVSNHGYAMKAIGGWTMPSQRICTPQANEPVTMTLVINSYGSQLPSTVTTQMRTAILDADASGRSADLSDPQFAGARSTLEFLHASASELCAAGFPGAQGAARLLGGVLTLIDETRERQLVAGRYTAGIQQADALFDTAAGLLAELSEAHALMSTELFDILTAREPPMTGSVAKSTSTAIWEDTKLVMFRYLETSLMVFDFNQALSLSGRRLVAVTEEGAHAKKTELTSLRARQTASEAEATSLGRSLAGKGSDDDDDDDEGDLNLAKQLAAQGLRIVDDIKFEIARVAIFGKEMHASMVELIDLTRLSKINRRSGVAEEELAKDWENAHRTFQTGPPSEDFWAMQQTLSDKLAMLSSLNAEFMIPAGTTVLQSFEANFERTGYRGERIDGLLQHVCNVLFYWQLFTPEACKFDVSKFSGNEAAENYKAALTQLQDGVGNSHQAYLQRKTRWVRVPVGTASDIRAAVEAQQAVAQNRNFAHRTKGQESNFTRPSRQDDYELGSMSLFPVDLSAINCGSNAEVDSLFFSLDRIVENEFGYVAEPLSRWEQDGSNEPAVLKVTPKGQYIKYDKLGQRHAFSIPPLEGLASFSLNVLLTRDTGDEIVADSVALPGGWVLHDPDNLGLPLSIPFNGKFDVVLGDFADPIANDLDPSTLVLSAYARLNVPREDFESSCEVERATNPPTVTLPPTMRPTKAPITRSPTTSPPQAAPATSAPTSEPSENSKGLLDKLKALAPWFGIGVGGTLVLSALIITAARRHRRNESDDESLMAKISDS